MMLRKLLVVFLFVSVCIPVLADQTRPGIPALQGNQEYMSLCEQDKELQSRMDAMQGQIAELRDKLRENPADKELYAGRILALEGEILSARSLLSKIVARINAIEQTWLADHPDYTSPILDHEQSFIKQTPELPQSRNLVYNTYFRENLPPDDYKALLRAQQQESLVAGCVDRLQANYRQQAELKGVYEVEKTEQGAVDLFGRHRTVANMGRIMQDSLAELWSYVYDNKTYAYDYILDGLGREELLARQEKAVEEMRRRIGSAEAEDLFEVLPTYYIEKQQLLDYEGRMAELLGLSFAADSLRTASERVRMVNYRLPKQELTERYFLNYEQVVISATRRYTYKNPIPECPIYAHGVIYRILIGEYRTKQDPSIFRNVGPLYLLKTPEGRYRYFAGGVATKAEAIAAQEQLQNKGFKRPELAVWYDGAYTNLSQTTEQAIASFRVEITGDESLSDAVKQAVVNAAPNCELSRVGPQLFVVGRFDNKAVADQVAAEIRAADGKLTIKVTEIVD